MCIRDRGDHLVVLADIKKGLAIPPKSLVTQFAAQIFAEDDRQSDAKEE